MRAVRPGAAAVLFYLTIAFCARPSLAALANKYAKFSKADRVRDNLRFSNVDDCVQSGKQSKRANAAAAAAAANATIDGVGGAPRRASWLYPDSAEIDQRDPSTFGFSEIGLVLGAHGTRGELKVSSDSDFADDRLCKPGRTWMRRPRRRAPREATLVSGRKGPGTNNFLITLAEVKSREEAAALRGATLFIRRELRPDLEADEMMLWELEGLTVAMAERASDTSPAENAEDAPQAEGQPSEPITWRVGPRVGVVSGVIPREELTGSPTLGNDLLEVELDEGSVGGSCSTDDEGEDEGEGDEADYDDEDEDSYGDPDTVLVPMVPQVVVDVRLAEKLLLIDPPQGLLELVQPKRRERVVIRALIPERAQSLVGVEDLPSK